MRHVPTPSFRPLLIATILTLAACGGGGRAAPGGGGGGGGGGATQLGIPVAKAAALGGHEGRQTATTMAVLAVDGVRAASALGAGGTQVRTYGTLVQDQAGQFTYQDTPTDRLRARLANGKELEFVITAIAGDIAAGGLEYLRGNHDLRFTVVSTGVFNLEIAHAEQARSGTGSIAGTIVIEGETVTLDLRIAGTTFYDRGFGSFHYELDERITGMITGPTVTATVDDTTRFVMIGDARTIVSQSSRRFAGKWQVDGVEWELRDAVINRAFRGGIPNELDTAWSVQGTLLRAGQPVGSVKGGVRDLAVKAWLDLGDGREVELESHAIR